MNDKKSPERLHLTSEDDSVHELERWEKQYLGVGGRLEIARKNKHWTQQRAADLLGSARNTIARYEASDRPPPTDFLLKACELYEVDPAYILKGDHGVTETPGVYDIDTFGTVPLYDVDASAGHGATIDRESVTAQIGFRRDWVAAQGWKFKDLAAISAKGDSMEPAIRDGDTLLIDINPKATDDGVYVIRIDHHLVVKRLTVNVGGLTLSSDNQLYKNTIIDTDKTSDLAIIGKVVWSGRRF